MKLLAATAVAALLATAAIAQTMHEQREAAMKTFGAQAKVIGDMLKGTTALDPAAANAALGAMQAASANLADLFAEPDTDPASEALPAIWENKADFDAKLAKFVGDINAAVAANPQDQASLQAAFAAIGSNCAACHEVYRKQN